MTSIALGTVPGSTVQWGSGEAVVDVPFKKSCGVGANPLAWSGLKPSWPVRTTVKSQPGPGWPRVALGTLKVMNREISLALMVTVPRAAPPRRRSAGRSPGPRSVGSRPTRPRSGSCAAGRTPPSGGGGGRVVDVDVDRLGPVGCRRSGSGRGLKAEDHVGAVVEDLEPLDVVGAGPEVGRGGVGVVARSVVVAVGVGDVQQHLARG